MEVQLLRSPAAPDGRLDQNARPSRDRASVQSLARALELLERLADTGGEASISQLAASSGLPVPTIHRLLRSLLRGGYVRQEPSRRYSLGARLIRLGEVAGRALGTNFKPHLVALAEATGETSNMAILDGDEVVYVAQAPSRHSMRMFTEVGRRVHAHSTGVGKALLSRLSDGEILAIAARTGMPKQTPNTITDSAVLLEQLGQVRLRGYAIDDEEQEVGVRCIAVAAPLGTLIVAVSVSGPRARIDSEAIRRIIPLLKSATSSATAAGFREG